MAVMNPIQVSHRDGKPVVLGLTPHFYYGQLITVFKDKGGPSQCGKVGPGVSQQSFLIGATIVKRETCGFCVIYYVL